MSTFRPILGAKAASLHDVRLPAFLSYKLDGWRATWFVREFFTRSGKAVPNRAVQQAFYQLMIRERLPCDGWDGELILGEPNAPDVFNKTDSCLKRANGMADGVRWFVFDNAQAQGGFADRLSSLSDLHPRIIRLDQVLVENYSDLEAFEERAVSEGFEGVVARAPTGRYKQGRSTLSEQYLVKVKRYIDEECKILRIEERMRNENEPYINEVGYTKRSTAKEGMVPAGTLGRIIVEWRGQELGVGTGWTRAQADEIWRNRADYAGKTCTIKHSPPVRDLPRQAVWKGLRSDLA